MALTLSFLVAGGCGGGAVQFDTTKWLTGAGQVEGENPRAALLPAVESRLRRGMLRSEVHTLLGDPDLTASDKEEWVLGRATWGIDSESLVVGYGTDARVTGWRLERS